MQINPAGGLTPEEVERLLEEADQHAQADRQRREVRQLKNRLEGLIYNNQRVFDQFRDMLKDNERNRINEVLLGARAALMRGERGELEVAMYDLNAISRKLSELMLDQAEV
jgi:molecular chaperone DnaK